MRKLLPSAALALLVSTVGVFGQTTAASPAPASGEPSCAGQEAETTKDRFTGSVTLEAKLSPAAFKFQPYLRWTNEAPDVLQFEVMGSSESWRYLRCPTLFVLVDDKPVTVKNPSHGGEVETGYVIEFVTGSIEWGDASSALAAARKFEYKTCNDESNAPTEFVCKVRDLIAKATALRKAPEKQGGK